MISDESSLIHVMPLHKDEEQEGNCDAYIVAAQRRVTHRNIHKPKMAAILHLDLKLFINTVFFISMSCLLQYTQRGPTSQKVSNSYSQS